MKSTDSGRSHVPEGAGLALGLEFLHRQAGADLLLEWNPADGSILNPPDPHAGHLLAQTGQDGREIVHQESRVHARADAGDAVVATKPVDPLRELRLPAPGKREFLARGNHVELRPRQRGQLRLKRRQTADGRDYGYLGRLAPQRVVETADNGDTEGRELAKLAQVLADLDRVRVHGPYEAKDPPLDRRPDHLLSQRSQPDVNDVNHLNWGTRIRTLTN